MITCTVTVVLPGLAAARARLHSGDLAAVLVGDREVLVRQQPAGGSSSPGSTLPGALSQVGGLQRLYALPPPAAASNIARHGIALPVHGLVPPPRGLASRITGLAVAILTYVIILTCAAAGVVLAGALWLVLGYAFYCAYAAAGSLITRQADAYMRSSRYSCR